MNWYKVLNPEGVEVKRVFCTTLDDLAANVPPDHTVALVEPEPA